MQHIGSPKTIAIYMIVLFALLAVAVISIGFTTFNINYSTVNGTTVSFYGTKYQLGFDSIPTIINGITAVTAIIIGFTGAIIGIFYQIFKDDDTTRLILVISAFYDIVPVGFLFSVYDTLLLGFTDFALKMALIALGIGLLNLVLVILGSFYRLVRSRSNQQQATINQPANQQSAPLTETKKEANQFSLQNAMNKLAEMCKIIFEDNKEIYIKKAEEVDPSLLKTLSLSFATLSILFQEAVDQWFGSRSKGSDAVQTSEKLEDRIDIKLYQTAKLDFEQMKKIMIRMNRIDNALGGLERVSFYLRNYENVCRQKSLDEYARISELFRVYNIEELNKSLKTESNQLRNQVERCNLYYQSDLNTKALNINSNALSVAYIALVISALSVLLTILTGLKLI